jgi:hypothetical protein
MVANAGDKGGHAGSGPDIVDTVAGNLHTPRG